MHHRGLQGGAVRMLLLPGMDGTGKLFERFIHAMGTADEAVVVPYPVDERPGYADLVRLAARHAEGGDALVIVAESFSGPVAAELAVMLGDRVRGLVLVASFVRCPLPLPLRALVRAASRAAPFVPIPVGTLLRRLMLNGPVPEWLLRSVRDIVRSVPVRVIASRIRLVLRADASRSLQRTGVPLLVLSPTRDRLLGHASANYIARLRPDCRIVAVDAPHLALQAAPEACAEAIRHFLAGLSPITGGPSF
ncbi:MAG: alpha/beta fold hydrolase [Bacteroidetes bacterium]|nr:alpha/beta fold hydrolase [Bacteroidota bacterium]